MQAAYDFAAQADARMQKAGLVRCCHPVQNLRSIRCPQKTALGLEPLRTVLARCCSSAGPLRCADQNSQLARRRRALRAAAVGFHKY